MCVMSVTSSNDKLTASDIFSKLNPRIGKAKSPSWKLLINGDLEKRILIGGCKRVRNKEILSNKEK